MLGCTAYGMTESTATTRVTAARGGQTTRVMTQFFVPFGRS
ncbi:hypothetical protein BCF74_12626 [Knoellia remsis]|uniref:Uncharacterized protein n=1 Tax=Knoellia remsis TaxID=407159 RepID=A0A2T0U812_9MICO|nr:hypothetical protein BCF74_12626 [Knoellia remsis]